MQIIIKMTDVTELIFPLDRCFCDFATALNFGKGAYFGDCVDDVEGPVTLYNDENQK